MSREGHVSPGRTRRSSTGQRVAGGIFLKRHGLSGRAMHKSSLIPDNERIVLWKATCKETCPCRLGRGQQKRTCNGTSLVPYFIWGGTVGNVPQGNALAVYSRGCFHETAGRISGRSEEPTAPRWPPTSLSGISDALVVGLISRQAASKLISYLFHKNEACGSQEFSLNIN